MTVWRHYGAATFDPSYEYRPRPNAVPWMKPRVGLWACEARLDRWRTWCEAEEFRLDRLERHFDFTLSASARILRIMTLDDLEAVYPVFRRDHPANPFPGSSIRYLDEDEYAAAGWDGIYADIGSADLYFALYGWDVRSLCVTNLAVVRPLE